jgi:hypothetical protein
MVVGTGDWVKVSVSSPVMIWMEPLAAELHAEVPARRSG